MMAALRPADLAGWLPIMARSSPAGYRLDWAFFDRHALQEPFFHNSTDSVLQLPFNQLFRRDTALDVLAAWAEQPADTAPAAFVFHASRCGSTLIARMLSRLASHTVLSEPAPLDTLLRAHYTDPVATRWQRDSLRGLLACYGQRRRGGERSLVVKLDAWNIFELPLLRAAFPDTPWIFLYRDPLEIVVSQLRQPGVHVVPGMLGASPLTLPFDEVSGLTRAEFVAQVIGQILAEGERQCRAHGGIAVNYSELPGAVTGRLAGLFDLHADDLALAAAGAGQHAKRPEQGFSPDGDDKRREAGPEVLAAVAQYAQPAYQALEALRAPVIPSTVSV
ncbi:hypothetical protein SAMN02745857_01184 [Andreprevotia lacus DSM 23236]|jgi:hypothetical protein|uniref:Sulfotransferase family protein n=1 Tax=Andreprevotia lacus DSM 23236 TaxID=1121001 RepID=A0A1W1XBS4_9NEIS|nr:sulfotransferase [Andreprevotia lacus]SMC21319.1 hypothetical protein SAMN02745857_01184 [Andreprevotia lacus DSM 23236]